MIDTTINLLVNRTECTNLPGTTLTLRLAVKSDNSSPAILIRDSEKLDATIKLSLTLPTATGTTSPVRTTTSQKQLSVLFGPHPMFVLHNNTKTFMKASHGHLILTLTPLRTIVYGLITEERIVNCQIGKKHTQKYEKALPLHLEFTGSAGVREETGIGRNQC